MKIAYLTTSEILSRAANSVQVMKMCEALALNGNHVVLFARRGARTVNDEYEYYGVKRCFTIVTCAHSKVRKLPGDMLYAVDASLKMKRQAFLPDLFYGRSIYGLAAVASWGIPMLYEAHTPPVNRFQEMMEQWVFSRQNFRRLIVISNALCGEYLQRMPWLSKDRILVAHDGADAVGPGGRSKPLAEVYGRKGHFQVGYVGHLYRGKGTEIIIPLASRMPEVDFHVIGGMENDLKHWRGTNGLSNLYFHGYVPHGDLARYYERLDVVLAPYQNRVYGVGGRKEQARWMSPLKIFEYMAFGKTIVCSDLPVLREVLSHKDNALLVPPEDLAGWIDAIRLLQKEVNLRNSLGEKAREDLVSRFTWKSRAEAVLSDLS